jgi:filamentous hemagglutinin family protein
MKNLSIFSASILLIPSISLSAPSGGQVSSGDAIINMSGLVTTINQNSQSANINWDSFNIKTNETVNFVQPNSHSSTLNQIHDANPSSILGAINSNGRVFLSNPNGFIFGANSAVNVGALFATTSKINNFSDDTAQLSSDGQGSILNQGTINTETGGYIGFFAPNIENTGSLNSPEGNITLSNANSGLLYLPNSAGIGFSIDSLESLNPIGIENTGLIKASGGQVLLSSAAIDTALRSAINNEGIIDVSAIHNDGGNISILSSVGSINQSGSVSADSIMNGNGGDIIMIAEENMIHSGNSSARGGDNSGRGGFVETSGFGNLKINSLVDTRALNGEWGKWLIDPPSLNIGDAGGTDITSADIINALSTNSSVEYLADSFINILGGINTGSATGTLILSAPILNIYSVITTDNLNLNSDTINFDEGNGCCPLTTGITTSGRPIFKNNTNLIISGSSIFTVLGTGTLSLNGANISGSGADDSLVLDTQNGKIDLQNMATTSDKRLNSLTINRVTKDTINANNENVTLSGDIFADNFTINNTTTTRDQNVNLVGDTAIESQNITFTNTNLIGSNSILDLVGTTSISLDSVDGIAALNTITPNLTLTGNISTQGDGINLSGGNISINKANGVLDITTRNTGNLIISSIINASTNDKGLTLFATDGAIEIDAISNIDDLTITNSSALTNLNGNIILGGDFIADTRNMKLADNLEITTGGNIDLRNTKLSTTNTETTTTLSAMAAGTTIKLGDITAGKLIVNSKALHLNGEVTTSKTIDNSLDLSNSGAILLEDNSVLNGNVFFGSIGNEITIDSLDASEFKSLEIQYDNNDLFLGQIGATNALDSFTLNGSGRLSIASTSIFSINTTGSEGISLLGNLTLDLVDALNIDTSTNGASGGDINLSGLNINGEFSINLNAGSGNISLATIGDTTAVSSLITLNSGNIELFGNINNLEGIFDFSNASSVILNENIIFGDSELYLASLLFGDTSINGNYDLTIFSSILTLGEIGENIALENLSINTLDQPININSDINTAGDIAITAGSIDVSSKIISTGGEIKLNSLTGITMSTETELSARDSNITLQVTEGDISIASLEALDSVNITAQAGNILNAINDYVANKSTSTNITAETINLNASGQIGASIDSPIIINAGKDGKLNLTAGDKIYIANLLNSATTSNTDVFDNSLLTASANADVMSQLKNGRTNPLQFNSIEISDPIWQLKQSNQDFKTTESSPRIYYSNKGWRLGNP